MQFEGTHDPNLVCCSLKRLLISFVNCDSRFVMPEISCHFSIPHNHKCQLNRFEWNSIIRPTSIDDQMPFWLTGKRMVWLIYKWIKTFIGMILNFGWIYFLELLQKNHWIWAVFLGENKNYVCINKKTDTFYSL